MVIRPTHPSSHPHPHPHPPIPRLHLETAPFGTVRRKGAGGVGRAAEGHTRLASGQRSLLLFCHPGNPARACEDHGRASKQPSSLGSFPSVGGGFHSCLPPVPFRSVAQSCPTLCDPMSRSTPGLPVHHHLPEFVIKEMQITIITRYHFTSTRLTIKIFKKDASTIHCW